MFRVPISTQFCSISEVILSRRGDFAVFNDPIASATSCSPYWLWRSLDFHAYHLLLEFLKISLPYFHYSIFISQYFPIYVANYFYVISRKFEKLLDSHLLVLPFKLFFMFSILFFARSLWKFQGKLENERACESFANC